MDICYQHSRAVSDDCGRVPSCHFYDNLHEQEEDRYKILLITLDYCNHVTFSTWPGYEAITCMVLCLNKSVRKVGRMKLQL